MQELRPDVFEDGSERTDNSDIDERVIAPTEALDQRDSENPDFQVDELLSCSNTDFGGKDPAL